MKSKVGQILADEGNLYEVDVHFEEEKEIDRLYNIWLRDAGSDDITTDITDLQKIMWHHKSLKKPM